MAAPKLPPAEFPGEAGTGWPPKECGLCGRPETRGATLVCDACDVGFHTSCVRPLPQSFTRPLAGCRGGVAAGWGAEDWFCPRCEAAGARTQQPQRWGLGVGRMIDINSEPPADVDEAGGGSSRQRNYVDVTSFGGCSSVLPCLDAHFVTRDAHFDGENYIPTIFDAQFSGSRSHFAHVENSSCNEEIKLQRSLRKRRRDSTNVSGSSNMGEGIEHVNASSTADLSLENEALQPHCGGIRSISKLPKYLEETIVHCRRSSKVDLPVQYEDFFITNLGKIDRRAAYHDNLHIWPVGFTSYWHDRITGSLFECEVSKGGSAGPVYRVRRIPCSLFPLPNASTIILHNNMRKADVVEMKDTSSIVVDYSTESEDDILVLLNDPSQSNQDFISCFNGGANEVPNTNVQDIQKLDPLISSLPSNSGRSDVPVNKEFGCDDKIGEILAEGRSLSSVWMMVIGSLIETCKQLFKQYGFLEFCCTHHSKVHEGHSAESCLKYENSYSMLSRFCSSSGPEISKVIQNDDCLLSTCISIERWLSQDRLGLDIGFVQEIIETLPGSKDCLSYKLLSDRLDMSSILTVANGSLLVESKFTEHIPEETKCQSTPSTVYRSKVTTDSKASREDINTCSIPIGHPVSCKVPSHMAADIFQILEFLWRFHEVLGINEVPSYKDLEEELIDPWPVFGDHQQNTEKNAQHGREDGLILNETTGAFKSQLTAETDANTKGDNSFIFIPVGTATARQDEQAKLAAKTVGRCSGVVLKKIHASLLRVLIGELLAKVVVFIDPSSDVRESKSRRSKKKEVENSTLNEQKIETLTINEMTWPELARRYVLAVVNVCMDWSDITSREGMKVFRCLHGDGGILCGALGGVAGMEADALLLAGTKKQIYDSTTKELKILLPDYQNNDTGGLVKVEIANVRSLPEWAQPLEPVKKLPTNVGTRIRKCVQEALSRNPPEWARKILEHSISKDVYKGNASGPTKKAVISVLAEASPPSALQKSHEQLNGGVFVSIAEVIMKKCRIALRRAFSFDKSNVFCNLLASSLINSSEIEDEGILGFPAMVSRPLDFRTVDLRLSHGAYCGSHETFVEDAREVIHNLRIAFADRQDLLQKLETLSQNFDSLYEEEVLQLVQSLVGYDTTENMNPDTLRELNGILLTTNEVPKAPWEDGVCKVCGIDKDDDSVLLCDTCDSEYHTYCLDPPLARIPDGNWYCPSCVPVQNRKHVLRTSIQATKQQQRGYLGAEAQSFYEDMSKLAQAMEENDYWDITVGERILLLKFLCDEVLKTSLIREHIEQSADKSIDIQQKLRALSLEWRNMKFKLDFMETRTAKVVSERVVANTNVVREQAVHPDGSCSRSLEHENCNNNSKMITEKVEDRAGSNNSHGVAFEPESAVNTSVDDPQMSKSPIIGGKVDTQGEKPLPETPGQVCETEALSASNEESYYVESGSKVSEKLKVPTCLELNNRTSSKKVELEDDADVEVATMRNSISQLHESGIALELQLTALSLRREYLGRDSYGRLYWAITRPGQRPYLLSDGSILTQIEGDQSIIADVRGKSRSYSLGTWSPQFTYLERNASVKSTGASHQCLLNIQEFPSSDFVRYDSDDEIHLLISCLKQSDSREKELRECILQWMRQPFHQESSVEDGLRLESPVSDSTILLPLTKAALTLENKYGPFCKPDFDELPKKRTKGTKVSEGKLYRCDCLEPVWHSRLHCLSCHQTFSTSLEYEEHGEGKCAPCNHPEDGKDNEVVSKSKVTKSESVCVKDPGDQNGYSRTSGMKACPFNFEQICKRFVVSSSTKDLMKDIGLISSNGAPSFVPSHIPYLDHITLLNHNEHSSVLPSCSVSSLGPCQESSAAGAEEVRKPVQDSLWSTCDDHTTECKGSSCAAAEISSSTNEIKDCLMDIESSIPESSLRPIIGRNVQILKQLKINLLDIEAALLEEAFKPSMSQPAKRSGWRTFLKSAESIYEMIQAIILFEGMIKAEFLKNDWWYWSSITAAVKTTTMSSLALRVYTLDDYIIYAKDPNRSTEMPSNSRSLSKGKKRKEMEA